MDIILIGPRSSKSNYGGIVVLFENLISNLSSVNKFSRVFDSNSKNYSNKLAMLLILTFKIFKCWGKHVSLHGTEKDFRIIGIILLIRNKLGGGSYSLRKFAGNYDAYFNSYNLISRYVSSLVLKNSKANFFETKYLVNEFKKYNKKTFWFPNVRPYTSLKALKYSSSDVFKVIYFSQVRKEKGILDLVEALGDKSNISLTIAGPIIASAINLDTLPKNVRYIGEILPENAYKVMSQHHLLALPTFYSGEGYPGVIIEAFMLGLPVLATKWRALPELVGDAGLLVSIKSPEKILNSVRELQQKSHESYRVKSQSKASFFSDTGVTSEFWATLNKSV